MDRGAVGMGVFLLAGGTAVILIASVKRVESVPPAASTLAQASDGMTLTTITDPVLAFQKAFWRRPARDDLNAERREWSTSAEGVKQWRWFLAVKPGPALRDWLAGNPFSLARTGAPDRPTMAPAWLPKVSKEFILQQKADDHLTFMWSAHRLSLHASDSGYGFAAPSAEPWVVKWLEGGADSSPRSD